MSVVGLDFSSILFFLHIILLLAGIVLLIAVPEKHKPLTAILTIASVAVLNATLAIQSITNQPIEILLNGGLFFGQIPIRIDALSAWFMLVVDLLTVTGSVYGAGYLKAYQPQKSIFTLHWVLFILFQSSMLWVCMVQHSVIFLIVWELMSLSSLLLVIFEHTKADVLKAGINYLVQMHLSVVLLTVGFVWLYFKTGTFDFKGFEAYFGNNGNIGLFAVFFLGFGFKSGFIGLHTWLPQAHPAAPSHVSGVMSGVIVKMGIYGIFRIITYLRTDYLLLGEIILSLSLLTGLYGIMNAAMHRDFKKMLAYCTIENIGIIGIGIGLGLIGLGKNQELLVFMGFGGALLHVLNHSLFKSLLFFSAGSVYRQTHTRNMDELGGLFKYMPRTAVSFLIGAVAIGGMPPFNGFISEFLLYMGLFQGFTAAGVSQVLLMIMAITGLSIIGGISILTFTKTFSTLFLGSERTQLKHKPSEVPSIMLVPQYVTIAVMLLVALFPGFFIKIAVMAVNQHFMYIGQPETSAIAGFYPIMQNISIFSLLFILLCVGLFFIRKRLNKNKICEYGSTWGCGYVAPTSRIQYTGKSYSKTLGKLLNFIIIEKKDYQEIEARDIFPAERKYSSHYLDFIELRVIEPFLSRLKVFIDYFKFVQNGNIQTYVLYGIIFILLVFVGSILNIWH
jgi:formate hydrogenlyase subunit 3/multisubunit Na+/H+ antiporter MnhD subunit